MKHDTVSEWANPIALMTVAPTQARRIREWVTGKSVVLVWGASFLFYFMGSWRPAWSTDEGATVVVVRSSWSAAWQMSLADSALGPFYLAMKPMALVSTSHLWLRLPSIVAAATAVALLFAFLRTVTPGRTAWMTTVVLIVLPVMTVNGAYARPYAFVVLGCVATVVAWWRFVEDGRTWSAAALVGALGLTGLAHAYALLIVLPLVAAAGVAPLHDRRRELTRTVLAAGAAFLLLSPWLVLVAARAHGSPNPYSVTAGHVAQLYAGLAGAGLLVGAVVLTVAVVGFVVGWQAEGQVRTLAVLVSTWTVLPPAALVVWQAATDKPGLVMRYWVFCIPALAIGVGLALDHLAKRRLLVAVAVLLALLLACLPGAERARSVDAHNGVWFADLVSVSHMPALESAPIIVHNQFYRVLLANDPHAAQDRFPLLVSPDGRPLDLVHPDPAGPKSPEFARLVATEPLVVVLQLPQKRASAESLTRKSFPRYRRYLKVYDVPVVLCTFSGAFLGVFARDKSDRAAVDNEAMARDIEAIHPRSISCVARTG